MNMSPARKTVRATSSAGPVSGRGPCGPGSVAVPLSRHRAGALRGAFPEVVRVSEVTDSDAPQFHVRSAPRDSLENKVEGG